MKKTLSILLIAALLISALAACGSSEPLDPVNFNVDSASSKYKHINNGGVTDDPTLPYNIDAITGATMTIEGPAVVSSTPLSVREIENLADGTVRGLYRDSNGVFNYEGLDVYFLIHSMSNVGTGITLTDSAYEIAFKNSNREEIARLTVAEIDAAHEAGRPIVLAYGMGTKDEREIAPFVFDGADKNNHSLGYSSKLKNDDGCVKLVFDNDSYGKGDYKTFSNVAYVYICEENTPGFKHTGTDPETFGASKYLDYIMTFRGTALGREFDLTTKQLEALVAYDKNGEVVKGGVGYSDWYSLANGDNVYWYVNEYEGLQLYELLQYLGMPSAEAMGTKDARTTLVSFVAADGNPSSESFSVDTLSYPDAFGFYKKSSQDKGDGSYVSTNADLVKLGYPVMLSYGVNDYPYTITKTEKAYVSGLSNSGGPFRVVFGKTQYGHENGAKQVQQVSEVFAGTDVLYNTHKYTDNAAHSALASSTVKCHVVDPNGKVILDKEFTIGEIEEAIYGEGVKPAVKKSALRKDSYEIGSENAILEGIDAEYFIMNMLDLPGKNGTVVIKGAENQITLNLSDIFAEGYNTGLNRSGLSSIFAYAKNGSPLVESEGSEGYEKEVALKTFLDTDPATYTVNNQGGPLMFVCPSTNLQVSDAAYVQDVREINIELIPDAYAHLEGAAAKYQKNSIKFYGPGLEKDVTYTVAQLENMQTAAQTLDYSMLNKAGTLTEERYRGLLVYDLFKQIGINNNAGDITVKCADGTSQTYSLLTLKKAFENFVSSDKEAVGAMIAFGKGDVSANKLEGAPLIEDGPLMLVVPQESADSVNKSLCLKNVVSVYVSANEIKSWGHAMSDVYSEFLDFKFTVTFKNNSSEVSKVYTVKEIENMDDIRVRDSYTVLDMGECEGVDFWKLVRKAAGDKIDLSDPIAVTGVSDDAFTCDMIAKVGLDGLKNGVATDDGNEKKVIISYAQNGFPLVYDNTHEGYTGLAGGPGGNAYGPLRAVVENAQGACLKNLASIIVTINGDGELSLD